MGGRRRAPGRPTRSDRVRPRRRHPRHPREVPDPRELAGGAARPNSHSVGPPNNCSQPRKSRPAPEGYPHDQQDNQTTRTAYGDLTEDQLASRHRVLDQLDALCAEHPGPAADTLAALNANYRARLPQFAGADHPEQAPQPDLAEADRHTINVEYTAPQGDLEIEQVTVHCACGEEWTTYLPFGAFETYRNAEADLTAPFLTRWRDHVHTACGLDVPPQPVDVLQMIEHLLDERGELIAERDAALARLDSEEIHDGCTADLETQKDLTKAAWDAHDATDSDAKGLRTQRTVIIATAAAIIVVLALVALAR